MQERELEEARARAVEEEELMRREQLRLSALTEQVEILKISALLEICCDT